MSSPFSLFRRHQRILMVVTTGLAMISFVLLGAISDPRNMPPMLVAILFAAMLGGIFWLAGLSRGKAADWGLTGTILGVVLALAMIWSGREAPAVTLEGGNLTRTEISELARQRSIANSFVQMAATAGIPKEGDEDKIRQAEFEANQRIRSNAFGFMPSESMGTQDVVLGEILRREAKEMGIVISDAVVLDFMKNVSDGKLTKSAFARIRNTLQVSETTLMDVLRQEIMAREAARLLSSRPLLTPENQWDFYQKLNVRQSAEIVAVPVSSFVTDAMQPSDAELQTLLDQYRENIPGYTPEGRPEEGRPGFFQLPKYSVAYLEAVFDDIKETVGEVTEEEIQQRYEEEYVNDVARELPEMKEEAGNEESSTTPPPALPPQEGESETSEEPKTEEPKTEEPKTEEPKTEEPKTEEPKTEEPKAEEPKAEEPKAEEPKAEEPKAEEPKAEEPKAEEPKAEEATEENSQSLNNLIPGELQFVAFQEEEAEAEAAAPENESAEAKEGEKKADPAPLAAPQKTEEVKTEEKPAKENPEEEKQPAKKNDQQTSTESAGEKTEAVDAKEMKAPELTEDDLPPPPAMDVPELTEDLKEQIREDILRERTQAKTVELMDAAYAFVNELAARYRLGDQEEEYISLDEATQKIKEYAEKNNLEYIETPLMTLEELRSSEDFPIGVANVQSVGVPFGQQTVVDNIRQSVPSVLFSIGRARRFSFGELGVTDSRYVFWKTGYKDAYSPKTIDDEPAVREQLVKVWKQQQADEIAKQRAEDLAKIVEQSDKPMGEALSDETVTGAPESLFLTVRNTGDFTMMTQGAAPSTNPFQQQQSPPRLSTVPGAEDAGERFFKTVFEQLDVGDVGVAPNEDGSVYYVVKVNERTPSSPEELNAMRGKFLQQGWQMPYYYLGQRLVSEFSGNWQRELMDKYGVQFAAEEPEEEPAEG